MIFIIKERSLLMLVLLSMVTCGIYNLYFWYQYTNDLNKVCEGDGKISNDFIIVCLLSLITCGIYSLFWIYGVGNRLQENAPRYGLNYQENGTTVLLWMLVGSILCGVGSFFALHILIKNMNELGREYNARFYPTRLQ